MRLAVVGSRYPNCMVEWPELLAVPTEESDRHDLRGKRLHGAARDARMTNNFLLLVFLAFWRTVLAVVTIEVPTSPSLADLQASLHLVNELQDNSSGLAANPSRQLLQAAMPDFQEPLAAWFATADSHSLTWVGY